MKSYKLLLWGILFATGMLNAQTDFRPGYIINLTGDTLYGEIDYRSDLLMGRVCRFRDKEKKITEYYPNDISAFRFINSKYYVSREMNHKKVFLEYLIKGKFNIYYLRDDLGDHYYFDKEDVELTELPYEEGIKYVGDMQMYYKTTTHIGLLTYYMKDAPNFQNRINSVTRPQHQTLIQLAKDYHNAVCQGEQCVIYEKQQPFIKVNLEGIVGVVKFENADDLMDTYYFQSGVIAHFWMPRSNEKMYFRTGVLFFQPDFNGEIRNYYKIPLQFEYIYPKGVFRPRFAYGFNFYKPFYQSLSLNLGGNIRLSEKIFMSATSEIEYNSGILIFLPRNILSYSLQFGIFLNI